jgi:putative flippase GtrA
MLRSLIPARIVEIIRYYQAGLINMAFGLGAYALLVSIGINMFAAQAIAHVAGVVFNYQTYSRHVFRGAAPAKARFIASYALNYVISLATLAAIAAVVESAQLAGAATVFLVSVVNYFVLKRYVFQEEAQ